MGPLKKFLSCRGVLALFAAWIFGLAQQGSAQNFVVSDYGTLTNAINDGFTVITNFPTTSTLATPTIIQLTAGETFSISTNIKIDAGSNFVRIQGDGAERFFYVHAKGILTLNNFELVGGGSTNGGAIYNEGTLIISNCVLMGNNATNTNGVSGTNGLSDGGNGLNGTPGGSAAGGAIYSTGPVYLSYSILTGNLVQAGNGGNGGNAGGGIGNGGSGTNGGNAYGGALYTTGQSNFFYMTEFTGNRCIAGNGGTGGTFAINIPRQGDGGAAGLGGTSAGGAVFAGGLFYMTNCLVASNTVEAGNTGAAEVDSSGGGTEGSPGGSALGGGLFITNGVTNVAIENSILFFNTCAGGAGGSTALQNALGGAGGPALGGGVWSGATLAQMSLCTLATNIVTGGAGGVNSDGGTNGITGAEAGWNIFQTNGLFDLYASILSYDHSGTNNPNAAGVTDAGWNVSSDATPTRSTVVTTTKLNTNPILDSGLSYGGGTNIGGAFGTNVLTMAILSGSPAGSLVPGVPGATYPAMDEGFADRRTPTSAGAFELNPIPTNAIQTNAVMPAIISTLPATNLTGSGKSALFTNTVNTQAYSNPLPFGYQWQLDGTNISDGTNYSGSASNILEIRQITYADQGPYTLLISPTLLEGFTNSTAVYLILTNPPVIKAQISSQLNRAVGSIVTFTLNVGPFPQAYDYQWMQNGTNLPARSEYTGTNTDVLTINPANYVDTGTYSVIVSNNYGSKTSAKVRLTIVPDVRPPTIVITNPAANNIRTGAPVFAGTASDNAQVTNVMYWFTNINAGVGIDPVTNVISGNAILTTNGNTNFDKGLNTMLWSITNTPLPGTNILAVQSVDYSSNVSTVVNRRFFYKVPAVLTLDNANNGGGGALTGHAFIHGDTAPANGALLNIGEGYSIVATPGAASLLGTWTNFSGTNFLVTNGNTLKFIMESNTVIQGSFVNNIFLAVLGSYNGVFSLTNEFVATNVVTNFVTNTVGMSMVTNNVVITNQTVTLQATFSTSGMLKNLVLGPLGTYSGRLFVDGGSYPLSGVFNSFGSATNYIRLPEDSGEILTVVMNVNTNGIGSITGTVSNAANNAVWPTNAALTAVLAAPAPGTTTDYTLLLLPSNPAQTNMPIPPGDGYALIDNHAGTVTLSGALADGTIFNQTVAASQSNVIPVYASLYNKTGCLFGWLNLTNMDSTNVTDGLVWIKGPSPNPTLPFSNGFAGLLLTEGSLWANPGAITLAPSNTLTISNAGLDLNYTVAIEGVNRLVNASSTPANSLNGTVNLSTGLLQVRFGNGNGASTTLARGVMLQDTTNAGGYFVMGANAGSITLNGSGSPPLPSDVLIEYLQSPLSVQDQQYAEYQYELTNSTPPILPMLPPPQAVLINGSGSP